MENVLDLSFSDWVGIAKLFDELLCQSMQFEFSIGFVSCCERLSHGGKGGVFNIVL